MERLRRALQFQDGRAYTSWSRSARSATSRTWVKVRLMCRPVASPALRERPLSATAWCGRRRELILQNVEPVGEREVAENHRVEHKDGGGVRRTTHGAISTSSSCDRSASAMWPCINSSALARVIRLFRNASITAVA